MYYTCVTKKLTITIDDEVYEGLYRRVGARRIGRFLEALARPHVLDRELEGEYAAMAADEVREADAAEWGESLVSDVSDETR